MLHMYHCLAWVGSVGGGGFTDNQASGNDDNQRTGSAQSMGRHTRTIIAHIQRQRGHTLKLTETTTVTPAVSHKHTDSIVVQSQLLIIMRSESLSHDRRQTNLQ